MEYVSEVSQVSFYLKSFIQPLYALQFGGFENVNAVFLSDIEEGFLHNYTRIS